MEADSNQTPETSAKKIDVSGIYPEAVSYNPGRLNEQKQARPALTKSFVKQYLYTFSMFLLGMLAIGVVGFLLGLVTKGPVIRVTGYFGGVANFYQILLYLVPMTLLFSALAFIKKQVTFAFYPVIIFFIGNLFVSTDLINLIGNYIPYGVQHESFNRVELAIASATVFMALYAIERPLVLLIRSLQSPPAAAKRLQIIYGSILVLVLISAAVLPKLVHSLYMSQLRSRAAVHIPDTEQMVGKVVTIGAELLGDVSIVYTESTEQYDGIYQKTDRVLIEPLKKWWVRDTALNCGSSKTLSEFPGQTVNFAYKKTNASVAYGETSFVGNFSNPPKASTAYNEYHYCFVIDYHMYTLIRSSKDGDSYLQKYPASEVIDAIVKGTSFYPLCSNVTESNNSSANKATLYCKDSDAKNIKTINEKATSRLTTKRPERKYTGIIAPTINKSAYTETGRLTINEWGISFPLNEDIKDAYYVPSNASGTKDIFTVSLKSLTTSECLAGEGVDAAGKKTRGSGVAFIVRYKTSEMNAASGTEFMGTTVGDYVYGLYGNANLKKCLDSMKKDSDARVRLSDIFDWSEAGIR